MPLPEATQIAGPGVPGLDHEAPVYHFDVPPEAWQSFIHDPASYLAKLGLTPDIAPRGQLSRSVVLDFEIWEAEKGWLPERPPEELLFARKGGCCFWFGGKCHCHPR